MTKQFCAGLMFAGLFLLVGCGGNKYADSIEVNQKFVQLMEEYVNALETASSADQVAKAMNDFADGVEVLAPKIKALAEKYPELRDPQNLPEALKTSTARAEELGKKMANSYMKIMSFMKDPAVQAAQKRVSAAMGGMA